MVGISFIYVIIICMLFLSFTVKADYPVPWQVGFQEPASDMMEEIQKSHSFIMLVMVSIVLIVFALLTYVIIKFRRKNNEKTKFNNSDNNVIIIEVLWTVIPLIIVGLLTINNIELIRKEKKIPEVEFTVKIIGYQWYWGYSYPEKHNINFESYMKSDNDLKSGELRLLEVDNRVIVPVNTNIRVQLTSADVIHSWAVPSLGIKVDAIPGRLNEAWFNIRKVGVYYGQCSELCGRLHGFMPIVIEAVEKEKFDVWVESKRKNLG